MTATTRFLGLGFLDKLEQRPRATPWLGMCSFSYIIIGRVHAPTYRHSSPLVLFHGTMQAATSTETPLHSPNVLATSDCNNHYFDLRLTSVTRTVVLDETLYNLSFKATFLRALYPIKRY